MNRIYPKIKIKCQSCKTVFEVTPSRIRKYCTYECSVKDKIGRKHSKKWSKKISKGLKGLKKTKEHVEKISQKNRGRRDTMETRMKKSIARKGGKNPNWRNGVSYEPYNKEWTRKLRQKIIQRDRKICQLCNKTENEQNKTDSLKRGLTVHHIDYNKKNCKENNLITLCRKCNSFVNYMRNKWIKFFKNKLKDNDIV